MGGRHPSLTWIVGSLSAVMIGVLSAAYVFDSNAVFTPFVWRPIVLAVLLAIVTELVLIYLLLTWSRTRVGAYYWILGFCIANTAWLLLTLLEMLSPTATAASFWQGLLPLPAMFIPVTAFFFTLSYTDSEDLPHNSILRFGPIIVTTLVLYLSGATNSIESHVPLNSSLEYWGYHNS